MSRLLMGSALFWTAVVASPRACSDGPVAAHGSQPADGPQPIRYSQQVITKASGVMKKFSLLLVVALAGCNVVPPLDCVMGVQRPGCQRDANGMYHYLYTSPLLPAPNSDAAPVGYRPPEVAYVKPPPPPPAQVIIPPPIPEAQRTHIFTPPLGAAQGVIPLRKPVTAYQQPTVAVTSGGAPMGVVVPMGGGNNVVVSPDGQPIGVIQ